MLVIVELCYVRRGVLLVLLLGLIDASIERLYLFVAPIQFSQTEVEQVDANLRELGLLYARKKGKVEFYLFKIMEEKKTIKERL